MLPTRTPGLLTISKQPRPPLKRKSLPKSKSTTVVRPSLLNLPPEITEDNKSGLPASQFRQRRGRGQVKRTKDRVQNQRWFQIFYLFVTWFDNRLIRSNPPSPSPPSLKSAKHKQRTPSSLVHSDAIPAPVVPRRQSTKISRSDSLPSHICRHPHPTSTLQRFPICDDMNDTADLSAPAPARRDHDNNLQANPISSRKPGVFPSNTLSLPSSPSKLPNRRKHRRTSSEGVFHISSDEDPSSGHDGTSLNPNVQALFGLVNTPKPSSKMLPSTPIRPIPPFKKSSTSPSYGSLQSKCGTSKNAAVYFASSMFQNSPSPEELPDPPIFWFFFSLIQEKSLEVTLSYPHSESYLMIFFISFCRLALENSFIDVS